MIKVAKIFLLMHHILTIYAGSSSPTNNQTVASTTDWRNTNQFATTFISPSLDQMNGFLSSSLPSQDRMHARELSAFDFNNLCRELGFLNAIPEISRDILPKILVNLPFDQAYELLFSLDIGSNHRNPLKRVLLNPLAYHNAHFDDQAVIKRWLNSPWHRNKVDYLGFLVSNPTVDIFTYGEDIMIQLIDLEGEELIMELVKKGVVPTSKVFNYACMMGSLDLISYLDRFEGLVQFPQSALAAAYYNRRDVLHYLIEHYANAGFTHEWISRTYNMVVHESARHFRLNS